MLSPKKTKFRKYHRGRMTGKIFLRFLFLFLMCIYYRILLFIFISIFVKKFNRLFIIYKTM